MNAPTANRSRIRYLTRFIVISPTFIALLFAISYFQTGTPAKPVLKTVRSAAEFREMLKKPRVVLLVSASWSDTVQLTEAAALQLHKLLKTNPQYNDVVVCNVDCSKQQGEVFEALNVLLKEQGKSTAIAYNGSGALVSVRKGKIVDINVQIPSQGMYNIMARTENAFIRR